MNVIINLYSILHDITPGGKTAPDVNWGITDPDHHITS